MSSKDCNFCLKISSPHHTHEKTKIFQIREQNMLQSLRYHPNYKITQLETPPRHVKKDLHIYEESKTNYLHPLYRHLYMVALNNIHSMVASYHMIVVLGDLLMPLQKRKKICCGKQEYYLHN